MSFLFPKMPSMPAPPQLELPKAEDVPSYQDTEREKAELEKLRSAEISRKGRRSTILTGGTGLTTEAETYQKSLLGG
jgi:molybdopterin biosynthesis enzyme MoaB